MARTVRFRDRREAGTALAARLPPLTGGGPVLVLGLPRGGVPVAFEVARELNAVLDVFVVRKLGVPGQEELAMGALASGGTRIVNEDVLRMLQIPIATLERVAQHEQRELQRRERLYRDDRPPLRVADRTVLLVDDGIATGSTMMAAIAAIRGMAPSKLVVAAPVAAVGVAAMLRHRADVVVCLNEVVDLEGVSLWYDDFSQTTDAEVRSLLALAAARSTEADGTE